MNIEIKTKIVIIKHTKKIKEESKNKHENRNEIRNNAQNISITRSSVEARKRWRKKGKKNWDDAKIMKNNGNKNKKLNYENLYALW